jgi:two-component sensor histidine kinase
MKSNAGKLEIQISDDGKGISPEFNIISSDSLGIQLINTLIEQLEGELIVDNSEGLKYLIIFEMQNI